MSNNSRNLEYVIEVPEIDDKGLLDDVKLFHPIAELGDGAVIRWNINVSVNLHVLRIDAFLRLLERFGEDGECDCFIDEVSTIMAILEKQIERIKGALV